MSKLYLKDRTPRTYDPQVFAELLRLIEVQVNQLSSGAFNARRQDAATAAPTTGTWEQNDIVWNSDCDSGDVIGWVCVVSGAPGTWKGFGTIA